MRAGGVASWTRTDGRAVIIDLCWVLRGTAVPRDDAFLPADARDADRCLCFRFLRGALKVSVDLEEGVYSF